MTTKTQDCSACVHRGPHPAPTHAGQIWYCLKHLFWVGDSVMNCRSWKAKG